MTRRESELRAMFALAAPLVLTELGWMAMGIVDTMFVGRVSADAIGAVSLGTSIFYAIAIFASGLLLGLDTLVSQSFGAGGLEDCHHSLVSGVWLALLLIPGVMGVVWLFIPLLAVFGIDAGVLRDATPYIRALNWSAAPLLLFFCLRRYLQSIGVVRPILVILITANLVNVAGNWVFVFGNLGAPRMGAEGSGWSTCIARVYMLGAMVVVGLAARSQSLPGELAAGLAPHRQAAEARPSGSRANWSGDVGVCNRDRADRQTRRRYSCGTPDRIDCGLDHVS